MLMARVADDTAEERDRSLDSWQGVASDTGAAMAAARRQASSAGCQGKGPSSLPSDAAARWGTAHCCSGFAWV